MVLTENTARKTTLRPSKRRSAAGFTLLEILIVLAIIAMVMSLGLPAIERVTYQRVNSTTRKFVGVIRTVRNDALLLGTIYRLGFNLDKNQWWVESQKQLQLLESESDKPRKKKKPDEAEPSNSGGFAFAEKFSKGPTDLPGGVAFGGVLKEGEKITTQGTAYIYFFPNGYNEQAAIYMKKDGAKEDAYSLIVRPAAGKVEIIGSHVDRFE